jgi:hypothetical protein
MGVVAVDREAEKLRFAWRLWCRSWRSSGSSPWQCRVAIPQKYLWPALPFQEIEYTRQSVIGKFDSEIPHDDPSPDALPRRRLPIPGNFSRAAELCNVTQSTLSTGLKETGGTAWACKVAERYDAFCADDARGHSNWRSRARDILARVGDFEDFAKGRVASPRDHAAASWRHSRRWGPTCCPACPAADPRSAAGRATSTCARN